MHRGGQRPDRADRSDVEDTSRALPDHLFVHRFGNGKQTSDVGADHFVPRAVGRGGKVIAAIDRGIVDQNIDAAPFRHQLAGEVLHAEAIRHRHFERTRAPAQRFDFSPYLIGQVVARSVIERHVGAFTRKHFAKRRTNATGAAGNECPFSFE